MKPIGQLDGIGWRIAWFRAGDRLAHRVEVLEGEEFREVLTSVEGTSDESWPTSPPLQEMHFEPRPGGSQVALLVGMAGKSHWSASVEMSAAGDRATFELACRAKAAPERLGSTYAVAPRITLTDTAGVWQSGPLRINIASGEEPLALASADASRLRISTDARSTSYPQTIRWAYSIELAATGR